MEKRISSDDERRLTYAVKTAAMLVNSDPTRDCNRVLADCLMENDVDNRFAKVASAAFNKQYTVTRFKETPDEHKIDDFPLSDSESVYRLMGGDTVIKTASVVTSEGSFSISISEMLPMQKTATVIDVAPKRPLYEATVSMPGLEKHISSVMTKQAAAHRDLVDLATGIEQTLSREKARLTDDMNKLGSFDRSLLCNAHADKLNMLYGGGFHKFANTGDPGTELSRRIVKLAALAKAHDNIVDGVEALKDGLVEFSSSAAMLGNDMAKTAGAAGDIGAILRGVSGFGNTALQGLDSIRDATNSALGAGFENAKSMSDAGDKGYAPGKVLDAEFLVKDRFRDRLLSWSDMTADPLFSMYPSEQVFMATQKAMDMDPSLERPDHRELLRTQVGQLLAQNNRASTADISALAATLKALAQSDNGIAQDAAASVLALDKKLPPDRPKTTSIFDIAGKTKMQGSKDYMAEAAKANQAEWDNEAKASKEKDEAKPSSDKITIDGFKSYLGSLKARPEIVNGQFTGKFLIKGRGGAVKVDDLMNEYKANTVELNKLLNA